MHLIPWQCSGHFWRLYAEDSNARAGQIFQARTTNQAEREKADNHFPISLKRKKKIEGYTLNIHLNI